MSGWELLATKVMMWIVTHLLAIVLPSSTPNEQEEIPNSWLLPVSNVLFFRGLPKELAGFSFAYFDGLMEASFLVPGGHRKQDSWRLAAALQHSRQN